MTTSADNTKFLQIQDVVKDFGGYKAVNHVNLDIAKGEIFALLGSSGCGKTTLLRMLAGFETPTSGRIVLNGQDLAGLPPYERPLNMMFQSYALFPHLTVWDNIAFGLRRDNWPRDKVAERVEAMLKLVQLTKYAKRKPHQLSGGQQQRVALARAIVIEPRVLLCDEPLGALDKKLRQQMQFELKQLQKTLGLTLVFVTHDQEEALAMSDRIAVMNAGRVEQVGTPVEIYDRPQTRFVADFIGDTNIFRGQCVTLDNAVGIAVGNGLVLALPEAAAVADSASLSVALRPEKIRLSPGAARLAITAGTSANGTVESTNFLGGAVLYRIMFDGGQLVLVQQPNAGADRLHAPGSQVTLDWSPSDLVILKD